MTQPLAARWIVEYARRPLNVVLLIAVPIVFVVLSAGALGDFADILSGSPAVGSLGEVEAATAGWAAAVLAGVSAFFHVSMSREADRRLAGAGAGAGQLVASRMVSTGALAALAALGSLIALRVRTDLAATPRVIGATLLFAVIYAGIGVTVGALVRSEMNGSLIVVFAWIFDVFFGPAMGGTGTLIRLFPLHFPTLVITDVASGHAGALGDLGLAVVWAVATSMSAGMALTLTTRSHPIRVGLRQQGVRRMNVAATAATRQLRRMPAMWVLIIGLPVAFITASIAVTPDTPTPVELVENGRHITRIVSMTDVHGAVMVPITVGFLASLAGLFVILDSAQGDRRLSLSPFRTAEILAVRMGVIGAASIVATAVALGVTAVSFDAANWPVFIAANLLVAGTYATIGVIVGPLFGRLGGLYLLLLLPFIDVGLAQNAMFDAAPPTWGRFLPAHGAMRVLMDGAFTSSFDVGTALLLACAWLVGLGVAATGVFRRLTVS
jgi:hypothetical protein